jgi:tRNA-dihydrouridine synthase B
MGSCLGLFSLRDARFAPASQIFAPVLPFAKTIQATPYLYYFLQGLALRRFSEMMDGYIFFLYNTPMLKIGSLHLSSNVLLAPLAGISDSAFRLMCRKFGASFTFVEMINARAISYKNKKTKKMLTADPRDRPIGVQILGRDISYLLKALDIIEDYDFDILDFNAACPVKKVCRRGEGAALMQDPEKLEEILRSLVRRWRKPVTVKIRSGWDQNVRNAVTIARVCQDAGIKAIFIHGRDRKQFYSGSVDYKIIADVKKNVAIPVIASGDIFSAPQAKKMFDETGCDGILVARGALGNPWIFQEIRAYLEKSPAPAPPSIPEILATLLRHLELSIEEHGEKNGVALMRKFVGWYLKGRRFVRPLRQKVNSTKTKNEFVALIKSAESLAE